MVNIFAMAKSSQESRDFSRGRFSVAWKEYYKGKKQLRDEDLAAEKEIQDTYKSAVQTQINALENARDAETQQHEDEINRLQEIANEYERISKKKQQAIDKEIAVLNRQKEVIEKKNKALEQEINLMKAANNLMRAEQPSRIVYDGSGWNLERDELAYQEAVNEYAKEKQNSATDAIDKQIEALNEQKEAISSATQEIVDKIDDDIYERQLIIKQISAPFDQLIKLLSDANTAMTREQLDPNIIQSILGSATGQELINRQNALNDFTQEYLRKYGKIGTGFVNDFFSYYKGTYQKNMFLGANDYANITKKVFANHRGDWGSSTVNSLMGDFKADLIYGKMTQGELQNWIDKLAKANNMTSTEWAKQFGLEDYVNSILAEPYSIGTDKNTTKAVEETAVAEAQVSTDTQSISENTTELLNFIKSNPIANWLFSGAGKDADKATKDVENDSMRMVSNINSAPTFTINIDGNADNKTINTMRTELTKAFNEYTDVLSSSLNIAYQRKLTT